MLEGLVQRNYEALNRRDLAAIMDWWADDAVWEFPGRTPVSGRFVGKPAIEAWWRRWVERYASVHFTVKHVAIGNPLGLTIANTLFVEWDAEVTTTDGISLQTSAVSFNSLRHGKVVYARDYFFDPTALERIWGRVDGAPAGTASTTREPALASSW